MRNVAGLISAIMKADVAVAAIYGVGMPSRGLVDLATKVIIVQTQPVQMPGMI